MKSLNDMEKYAGEVAAESFSESMNGYFGTPTVHNGVLYFLSSDFGHVQRVLHAEDLINNQPILSDSEQP
jgi:hypothetical protein